MTRVAIIGAGGLGGPVAFALAAAGLELVVVDDDVVERSNLHRQLQFTEADVGAAKVDALRRAVAARGDAPVVAHRARWTAAAAEALTGDADVVVECTDDPETKFAVSDWAVAAGRPCVVAAALGVGGSVHVGAPGHACYRCLFEAPPDVAPTCADAGVLGPVVAAVGGVAAAVALALARGDRRLAGAILVFDDLRRGAEPRVIRFAARPGCPACAASALPPGRAPILLAGRG